MPASVLIRPHASADADLRAFSIRTLVNFADGTSLAYVSGWLDGRIAVMSRQIGNRSGLSTPPRLA
ncbi:hypothetical protein [Antarcticirhabdus aurantiaca]|uniref:Uncharacterized protein n=1 Tax=Antarcticirhabdus aurantiaca TaxID=2606717 RepID=A0ACD4NP61_9HYPH|nr:hypothetical protein [Antarcticirhabdus aurantiaca]WAJ28430.1 hypothetical protein OXU80_27085 [Jeongeuplla avenae]